MTHADVPLINNEALHNFEFNVNGQRSFIDYFYRL